MGVDKDGNQTNPKYPEKYKEWINKVKKQIEDDEIKFIVINERSADSFEFKLNFLDSQSYYLHGSISTSTADITGIFKRDPNLGSELDEDEGIL